MMFRFRFFRRALSAALALCLICAFMPALAEDQPRMPWINSDMDGNVTKDLSFNLKDDFHLAVNKDWLLHKKIPYGASSADPFSDQAAVVTRRKLALLNDDSLTGPDADLMRTLISLILDWDTRNKESAGRIRAYIDEILALDTMEKMDAYLTGEQNVFLLDPSLYSISEDLSDPTRYVVFIAPAPLSLSDSAEYFERTDYGDMLYDITEKSALVLLKKVGFSQEEAQEIFDGFFAYETLMASFIRPEADQYALDYMESIIHYYDRAGLEELCGNFPMARILEVSGYSESETFLVTEPAFFTGMQGIYTEENLPLLRDWLVYYVLASVSDAMDRDTCDQLAQIRNEALGSTGLPDDMDIVLDALDRYLPVPMDNLYIQANCTEKMRQDILEIISEVIENYREMLQQEEWLSPQTREKAIEKLDSIRIRAVYPDQLGDWSGLHLKSPEEGGSMLDALMAITAFSLSIDKDKINQSVPSGEWDQMQLPTSEVNASYLIQENSINIMAGILGGEFYSEDMSREEKLGAIGMVIGHEISHAFDTTGANFGPDGAMNNWWTPEDYAAFVARTERLAAYYDTFVPYPGGVYSGQKVQAEAIADMAGVKCMLSIAAKEEHFDYDAFFRKYASIWRSKAHPYTILYVVGSDSHPLGCLRTNVTVQQFEEFYQTYQITPRDQMYLAPEDRVAVW